MSLTRSLCCHRLSFTDTACCPTCGKTFQPGALHAKAVAEARAFSIKAHAIFLGIIVTLLGVLIIVQFQPYVNAVGN
jgi:hypothetical protein